MGFGDGGPAGEPRVTGVVLWVGVLWGALAAVLTAPVAAAMVASVYRFPIPFGVYARGPHEAVNAALAAVFYLVMGGGLLLAALGGAAGLMIVRAHGRRLGRALALTTAAGFGLAVVGAFALALLEHVIGPW
ncbi:hypothetical protein B7C42_06420 [Nocardia cerradoensis]|uniref:Uncharacterized protein n=1 Tax=Nocardia cerradoensis TaxID=85688 RepID=A0A231GY61_9NOCA|nr:hypothetical protein B7C42_06420 [Nocardia cerradoensis]